MGSLTENALRVLERRYLKRDESGNIIETPEQMFRRVADAVAQADRKYFTDVPMDFVEDAAIAQISNGFFDMMMNLEFLPNSPTLMNAGRPLGQLAACFVLPVYNTVEEILDTMKHMALIHKSGGGTGFNFSRVDLPQYFDTFRPLFIISESHPDAAAIRELKLKFADVEVLPEGNVIKGKGYHIEDNMESIFSMKEALLPKPSYIDFSNLRAKGTRVKTTNGEASGPASFMQVWDEAVGFLTHAITPISAIRLYNATTEAVKQGGTRRGANMGIVNVDNKYVKDFMTCKKDNADITNFNLSVGIFNNFMEALARKERYALKDYVTGEVVSVIDPNEIFDMIVDGSWANGEPGIIFLDKVNANNPILTEMVDATNPCGEQPLFPYEACNLGSINLSEMLKRKTDGTYIIDEGKLTYTIRKAIHFLDNVIDVNKYPLPEIEEKVHKYRKIGLGVMGWADILYKMGIPYNSEEATTLADAVADKIQTVAALASIDLAKVRGSFPAIADSIFAGTERRNATTTTIAPTGTLSMIASVSSGIEPQFAISYIKNVMDNDELSYVNPIFKEAFLKGFEGVDENDVSIKRVFMDIAKQGSVTHVNGVSEGLKKVFVTSHDIDPEWHVAHQAAWQVHTDNAVSKTVNLRKEATKEDVRKVYSLAFDGCKGVTIYRDQSRENQVLNIGAVNKTTKCSICGDATGKCVHMNTIASTPTVVYTEPKVSEFTSLVRPRPEVTVGFTQKVKIGCGNLYVTVNYDKDGVCEVFTSTGRSGGCPSQSEATSRLVSLALRSWVDVKAIMGQLKGIRCPSAIGKKTGALSCPDAIGRALEQATKINPAMLHTLIGFEEATEDNECINAAGCAQEQCAACAMKDSCNAAPEIDSGVCPECGKPVEHEGGCLVCRHCGFSKCG